MRRGAAGSLVLLVLSVSSPGNGIDFPKDKMRLEVRHKSLLGGSYKLKSISFVLDGNPIVQKATGADDKPEPNGLLYEGYVETGDHSLKMEFVYEGRSSIFFYVNSYRFFMKARVRFHAAPDYVFVVHTTLKQHNDITIAWEKRPYIEMNAVPTSAVLRDDDDSPSVASNVEVDAGVQAIAVKDSMAEAAKPARSQSSCSIESVLFPFNSAEITAAAEAELRALAACLEAEPKQRVRIEGHCDQRGSHSLNDILGMKRVRSVAKYLEGQRIKANRLRLHSFGKRKPRCIQDLEQCHAQNRRVEVVAVPEKEELGSRRKVTSGAGPTLATH